MHQDAGNYAGKHPDGTELNRKAADAVNARVKNKRISCKAAHDAAAEALCSPAEIGKTLDLLEVRIIGCQLGLFGHGGKDHGKAVFELPPGVEQLRLEIERTAGAEGISCHELWEAAAKTGFKKVDAAAVCEEAEIKIYGCQLGAF